MSMIVPAGYKNIDWVPSDSETKTKLTKTAGIGDEVGDEVVDVVEEVADVSGKDALYNAAKEVVDAMDAEGMDSEVEEVADVEVAEVSDDSVVLDVEEEVVPEKGALDEAVEEVVEDVAVDKVEEVVEKIVEDVAELQDVVQGADDVTEIGEEEAIEVDVEVEAPEDNEEEGLIVESEPDLDCALAKDEAGEKKDGDKDKADEVDEKKEDEEEVSMDKSASVDGEFVKFAKLTPSNRKKIISYWKNDLNYPADYVALMAKDYEK